LPSFGCCAEPRIRHWTLNVVFGSNPAALLRARYAIHGNVIDVIRPINSEARRDLPCGPFL